MTDEIKEISQEEMFEIWERTFLNFKGNSEILRNAFGMLMMARTMGWKPIYLMHGRATIKEYERILGVKIQERCVPIGKDAHKSMAWRVTSKLSNFWKAVKGEYPDVKTNSPELVK